MISPICGTIMWLEVKNQMFLICRSSAEKTQRKIQ